ncbi:NupC/NupG family nucleoside CNT transporter [Reichenbachiella agarivorans]|uniref:NupC/NupG family nucleoside CNT transporter n=1 Tax=Reichenbachiella agarivorans TaxID=2979464 RepID=A0ABY6CPQ0_9BACT|nr:nucleoside transporter C-terminal domain-containing protein [Reichenbachiella agarivorans]UXP32005.1 NupC/NupG family nucleoside CNT transporter [Reichenbachiella agarivorans]
MIVRSVILLFFFCFSFFLSPVCAQDSLLLGVSVDSISVDSIHLVAAPVSHGHDLITHEQDSTEDGFVSVLRGMLGIVVLLLIAWLFSSNRKAISWKIVGIGLGIQLLLAVGVLHLSAVRMVFEFVGKLFTQVLEFTKVGSQFLFGNLMSIDSYGFVFALQILPTIIFFSAITSVLFYLGIIQKVVYLLAWLLGKALKLSGAESLSVAGNIFLGQTEASLLIKGYIDNMNRSEILLVMTGGMATVAGGVLAAYIGFLGGDDPVQRLLFAKHLLAASIMAAPGAVIVSKIIFPQTEAVDREVKISKMNVGSNFLDALSNGTTEGLKLAMNVGAMLLVFFAFLSMMNFVLFQIGSFTGWNETIMSFSNGNYSSLSLEFILGYLFAPLMWLIGVGVEDITLVGRLLGEKIIASEFVGYESLARLKGEGAFAQTKSIIMATYMLCGFANFASIGIQIGGIGGIAPSKKVMLSELGFKALIAGTIASLLSATIVGMIM